MFIAETKFERPPDAPMAAKASPIQHNAKPDKTAENCLVVYLCLWVKCRIAKNTTPAIATKGYTIINWFASRAKSKNKVPMLAQIPAIAQVFENLNLPRRIKNKIATITKLVIWMIKFAINAFITVDNLLKKPKRPKKVMPMIPKKSHLFFSPIILKSGEQAPKWTYSTTNCFIPMKAPYN